MAITDATRTKFKYGAALPDSNLVAGSFYIVAPNDSFLELYLATSVSSAQHIGALHSVSDVTGLPVAGNTDSLYFTNDAKGLYHWNGATYDKLNEGQTYTADEETLTLINNEFSVLDSGINTLQIADAAITNAKIANMNAYTMKANNTNAAFAPLDVALVDMILNGYLKTSDTGVIAASDTLAIALSRIENNTANVVSAGSSLTTGYLVQGSGNKNVTISSVLATNVVTQIANSTSGRIMISGGNKVITDSGIIIASTITDNNSIVPTASAVVNYAQPLDETNLTQIAALTSGNGLLKKSTADNVVTWSFDTTAYLPLSQKGIANGVPTLDADGKVPSSQLPSYVDDVLDEISMCYAYSTAPVVVNGEFYFNTTSNTLFKGVSGAWSTYVPTEIYSFANLTDNLIYTYDTGASAWGTGTTPIKSVLYVDDNTGYIYRYSGTVLVALTSGNPTWGTITGTLSDQTDLWAALSARPTSDTSTTTGNLAMYSNNTGTAIGDSAIIAANVVTTTSNFASNQLVVGRGNNKSLMALASGSEGQVLKMVSGIPAWGTEYSYTLPATSTTALGGVRLGYDASGNASYLPLVTDTGDKAYVALTLASINTVKPNIVTGSGLTSGYLVLGNGGNGVAVSTISATNVVTASGTLTSGTLLVGAGEKAVAASSYSVVTSISSASTDTNIPSAKAVYTYVDSQALTWETF